MARMQGSIALALACLAASPLAAQDFASSYTRHDYEACRKSPSTGDFAETSCAGPAGIRVLWTAEADSSSVAFGERTAGETLFEGLDFFEVGSTIEWRGVRGQRPLVAIVRYKAGKRIGKLDVDRLVVHRIGSDGLSCIIGAVDGRRRDANAAARKLADTHARSFRCGQDKRIEG
jgi:hypothetical protein